VLSIPLLRVEQLDVLMPLNDAMSRAVRELMELVAEVRDTDQLRELLLAIDLVLHAIDRQRVKLEGDIPSPLQ
jgi:hypothetical protein